MKHRDSFCEETRHTLQSLSYLFIRGSDHVVHSAVSFKKNICIFQLKHLYLLSKTSISFNPNIYTFEQKLRMFFRERFSIAPCPPVSAAPYCIVSACRYASCCATSSAARCGLLVASHPSPAFWVKSLRSERSFLSLPTRAVDGIGSPAVAVKPSVG